MSHSHELTDEDKRELGGDPEEEEYYDPKLNLALGASISSLFSVPKQMKGLYGEQTNKEDWSFEIYPAEMFTIGEFAKEQREKLDRVFDEWAKKLKDYTDSIIRDPKEPIHKRIEQEHVQAIEDMAVEYREKEEQILSAFKKS